MEEFVIPQNYVGKRVDFFLYDYYKNKYQHISRSMVAKNVNTCVSVNEIVVKKGYILKDGDILSVDLTRLFATQVQLDIVPEIFPLDILEETSEYIVLNKPEGVAMHPGVNISSGTMANFIKGYLLSKGEYDENVARAGIVHRLDKSVSGLVIVAKTRVFQQILQRKFENHEVFKLYHAVVKETLPIVKENALSNEIQSLIDHGYKVDNRWIMKEGVIVRDSKNRLRMRFSEEGSVGLYAKTYILFLDSHNLLVNIETGRMHQIRATLKSMGYTIVGDSLYGVEGIVPKAGISLQHILMKFNYNGKEKMWKLV